MIKITAVAATSIMSTGSVDSTFLDYAYPECRSNTWGTLQVIDATYAEASFHEIQEVGWSSPQYSWFLELYRSGQGWGHKDQCRFREDGTALADLLMNTLVVGDYAILILADLLPHLRTACQADGIELVEHWVEAALSTSGNPSLSNQ